MLLVQGISQAVVVLALLTPILAEREALEVVAQQAVHLEQTEKHLLVAVVVEQIKMVTTLETAVQGLSLYDIWASQGLLAAILGFRRVVIHIMFLKTPQISMPNKFMVSGTYTA